MTEAYIFDAVRTPRGRGKSDGSLHDIPPVHLLTTVFEALRDRNHLDTSYVEDAIIGCVTPIGEQGADIARTAAIAAGYAQTTAGVQLNRYCSSGLEAVNMAAAYVMSGQVDMLVAGGVESMSRVPMGSDGGAIFMDPGLIARHKIVPQGISADLIASRYGYTRESADRFAVESHRRATQAYGENRFQKALVPVRDDLGITVLDRDEGLRPETTVETLAKLKPSFEVMGETGGLDALALQKYPEVERICHIHHAGNSSQIVDGAALLLIGNKQTGEKLGLRPRARIRAFAVIGSCPTMMLTGPVPATRKLLQKNGLTLSDIDLFEINEAFAVVPMAYMDELGVDHSRLNVNGGAIALGHPLGATGSVILATLLDELERQDKATGLASLCIGGGMGIATLIERI
jgi:acetyl-CoA C-acetyltransferase